MGDYYFISLIHVHGHVFYMQHFLFNLVSFSCQHTTVYLQTIESSVPDVCMHAHTHARTCVYVPLICHIMSMYMLLHASACTC